MNTITDYCRPNQLKKHTELRDVISSEHKVTSDIRQTETDRLAARSAFQTWSAGRSDDLNVFGDILHDSFRDQRSPYREYYQKSEILEHSLRKALQEEKFLDPTKKELKRREKVLHKSERQLRKARLSYDKATNKPDFEYRQMKQSRKVNQAEMKVTQAKRMVDTSQEIYRNEEQRITEDTRHGIINGYCQVMKQEYVLLRNRIQELERVFEVVRVRFPHEAASADLPQEKLTPILKLGEQQQQDKERMLYEKDQQRRPKITLDQAVAAALPDVVHKQRLQGSGTMSPKTRTKFETNIPTAPIPPPVPTKQEMDVASRHILSSNA
jgi:hypothetical protein